ncbi:unannotated protein [freshwater metagenome]|uniref:Unannotated protein n=1 Tax=freshwater metagenome TaxID=449393 RepID=A0A6J7JBR8_9ZZZZ|nr:zinc-binding dehydrogenase [Actinomycetota bacterium]
MTRATAARLVEPGRPLDIQEVDLADPAAGEVLVELTHAGVNPFDRYNAAGLVLPDGPLPRTIGGEATGTLDGRAVLVVGGPTGLGLTSDGTWATAVVTPAETVLPLPDGVDPVAAATLGVAGQTAWQAVHSVGLVTSADRVVVLGASGGVGGIAVALAAQTGAEVWGQTTNPENAELIRESGAHHVLVGGPEALDAVKPTVAFDALGGAYTGALVERLRPGGRLVSYGTSTGARVELNMQSVYRKGLSLLGYASLHFAPEEREAALLGLLDALATGALKVRIAGVLPLAEAQQALDLLAQRAMVGKLVLDLRA